jgi:environmental stress-induced protein Ves
MQIIRSADYRQMPWKNGGGTTTEIVVSPQDSRTGEFDWRISMATILNDGWFSEFPQVDRTLSILQGNAIHLAITGGAEMQLSQASAPFHFPADAPAYARLTDGPVVDLNVMTRRTRFTHRMTRLETPSPVTWQLNADITALLVCTTPFRLDHNARTARIAPLDTAIFYNPGGSVLATPDGRAEIYVIEFNRV